MKKKSIAILVLMVVIAVALNYVAFFGYNIAGFQYGGIFDPEKGIKKGIDLAGGSVIVFQADAENPTEEEMQTVQTIFETRLYNAGYSEGRASIGEGGQITVEIPAVFDTDSAVELLGSTAQLTFRNADGQVVLDGATDIKDAQYRYGQVSETGSAEAFVELTLNSDSVSKWADATRAAAAETTDRNYISIFMDETEISRASVRSELNDETCVISGGFTTEEAQTLANQIKSGALPFKLNVVSQDTIGAELGEQALPNSLLAAGIGIVIIILFMILIYRVPGLLAGLALLIYVGIVSMILGLGRVNLSLSGIAGIVLSIGMAVDANVIIFERMKEELRLGKTIKAAVDAGFSKAFSAILDSNITTIISCVVLYLSGINTIKGFAVTLGLGVIVSMFTAIVITKLLLKQLVRLNIKNRKLFLREKKEQGTAKIINVTKNKVKLLIVPIVIVAAGIVMYFVNSGFNFDIEFMGGIRMQVDIGQTFDNQELSDYLEEQTGITPIIVQKMGTAQTQAIIKTQPIEESKKNDLFNAIKEKYGVEDSALLSVNSASASFGQQVQQKALIYTIIAILCILIYIAFRFEWRSAIMAVISLAINILVMMAVYAMTYTPLNTTFIAAMLTVIGYSINNTIVVFDRIRENMKGFNVKKSTGDVNSLVDRSITESMGRTINTTITTLITIVLLYFLGVQAVKEFAFPLIIGVIIGAFTSIFVASPFWASWKQAEVDAKKQKK